MNESAPAAPAVPPSAGARATILAVDDDAANLTLLADLLKDRYRVLLAKNGEKALQLARDQKPNLILLDVLMPGLNGFEVLGRLKADEATRDVPVIFLTGLNQEGDEAKGLALGAVDYVTKPFSPAIVEARVSTHLTLQRARQFLVDQNAFLESEVQRRLAEIERIQDVFGRIVDPRVRDYLLQKGQTIGGDLTQGAIMFCDIRSFTSFSESRDPRTVVRFLNRFFSAAATCVLAEGGFINKYLGDAFMAVFGTPFPLEDHRLAALRAAQAVRRAVARMNAEEPDLAFAIGIGLASGPMVAGIVGSPERMEFTTIGDTVNTASRLESLCKEYKTDLVFGGALLEGMAAAVSAVPLGTAAIRGKETAVTLYSLPPEAEI